MAVAALQEVAVVALLVVVAVVVVLALAVVLSLALVEVQEVVPGLAHLQWMTTPRPCWVP